MVSLVNVTKGVVVTGLNSDKVFGISSWQRNRLVSIISLDGIILFHPYCFIAGFTVGQIGWTFTRIIVGDVRLYVIGFNG